MKKIFLMLASLSGCGQMEPALAVSMTMSQTAMSEVKSFRIYVLSAAQLRTLKVTGIQACERFFSNELGPISATSASTVLPFNPANPEGYSLEVPPGTGNAVLVEGWNNATPDAQGASVVALACKRDVAIEPKKTIEVKIDVCFIDGDVLNCP
jgi:hypothetical protein